jgi:hypothetical protein
VTVSIVDDTVNTAPFVRHQVRPPSRPRRPRSIRGGHVSVGVLADWRDAESDPVVVEALDPIASVDGAGALAITAPNQPGPLEVKYKVDDGRGGSTEAKAALGVLGDSDRAVPPTAQADVVRAIVGKPVQLQPLGNDLPGADPTDPTARLRLAAEVRGPAGLMIDTNVETGVVTVTGAAPGSHLLTYAAQVGSAVGAGGSGSTSCRRTDRRRPAGRRPRRRDRARPGPGHHRRARQRLQPALGRARHPVGRDHRVVGARLGHPGPLAARAGNRAAAGRAPPNAAASWSTPSADGTRTAAGESRLCRRPRRPPRSCRPSSTTKPPCAGATS